MDRLWLIPVCIRVRGEDSGGSIRLDRGLVLAWRHLDGIVAVEMWCRESLIFARTICVQARLLAKKQPIKACHWRGIRPDTHGLAFNMFRLAHS